MRNFDRVRRALLLLGVISVALVGCDESTGRNETRTLGLQDPSVDANVKAALENGTVSEVVVRKDLLLFPVNAPNLVIAHSQEIHAVPESNGTNVTDGKPVAAQVAEVNEYSLSQLVNDTDGNGTASQGIAIPASPLPGATENDSVLEPGKLLEIVSGFNLSNGMATEEVPLPSAVQNFSLPKHSIVDLLSKSLPPADESVTQESSHDRKRRSADDDDDDDNDNGDDDDDDDNDEDNDSSYSGSTDQDEDGGQSDDADLEKRSVESEEDEDSESASAESSAKKNEGNSTTQVARRSVHSGDDMDESSTDIGKRSIDSYEDDCESDSTEETATSSDSAESKRSAQEDSDPDSTEETPMEMTSTTDSPKSKRSVADDSASNGTDRHSGEVSIGAAARAIEASIMQKSRKESLVSDTTDDMDVAEDIVFRPLFRYRQETQLRQRNPYYRRSRYTADNSDYD